MIGFLKGYIIDKQYPGKIVINVNGVGYDVEVSLLSFLRLENIENEISLYIQTIVREDAFLLFGFIDKAERAVFRSLIKVNGIGPKVALGLLSSAAPEEIMQMVLLKNVQGLTQLPGIGKKTAERLIVEMQGVFTQTAIEDMMPQIGKALPQHNESAQQAILGLETLGYSFQEASKMIKKIDDGHKSCETLIREALKQLSSMVT